MSAIRFFALLVLLSLDAVVVSSGSAIQAPCVFRADEAELHKYAAICAATGPFRKQCSDQIRGAVGPLRYLTLRATGKPLISQAARLRGKNSRVDAALGRYEDRLQMMLRSYGMDAHSFNSISQALNKQPGVKRRMQLQTFYYKIAADLVSNLKPAPPTLPDISSPVFRSSTLAQSQAESAANLGELGVEAPVKQRFARSLRAIERERLNIRNNLMAELRMRELPPNMCDPSINPFLCPAIRKACAEYPSAAAAIIQQNGLETEQFNALQKKLARNLLFRLSVQREIDSIQKQAP